jgi:hypothetical protein
MKKLAPYQHDILRMIAAAGGSFCPDDSTSVEARRALDDLVKAKRLRVEAEDGALVRYHLTGQGAVDAKA